MNRDEWSACCAQVAQRRMRRAVVARPRRAWVAARLVALLASAPAWKVDCAMSPSRRAVANAAVRVSEWLLGVPAGSTRAALGDTAGAAS